MEVGVDWGVMIRLAVMLGVSGRYVVQPAEPKTTGKTVRHKTAKAG